jgi:hypothetical protein
MSDISCTYDGRRDEMLVDYLYDELDAAARRAFDAHLASCGTCRGELAELRAVRTELAEWAPPEPARVLAIAPSAAAPRRNVVWSALAEIPAWAQVAAAMLALAVAAGVANLQINYGAQGLTVRTGWLSVPDMNVGPTDGGTDPAGATARSASNSNGGPSFSSGAASDVGPSFSAAAGGSRSDAAPWAEELAALERDLRAEIEKAQLTRSAGAPARADDATLARVRAMIEASERNQRRELALRVAEVAREVQTQRVADLQRIQRSFAVLENSTSGAIFRQGRLLDNLAVRVSSGR